MEKLCQFALGLVVLYHAIGLVCRLQKRDCIESVQMGTISRNQGDSIFCDKDIVFSKDDHTIIVT